MSDAVACLRYVRNSVGGWEQTVILVVIDGYDDVVTHDASHLVVVNSFFEQLFSKVILRMHNFGSEVHFSCEKNTIK